mgnify:FL=1
MTWEQRIDQAEARGGFTEEDGLDAEGWPSCAWGETTHIFTRPQNKRVFSWGIAFANAISDNQVSKARRLLRQIQRYVQAHPTLIVTETEEA